MGQGRGQSTAAAYVPLSFAPGKPTRLEPRGRLLNGVTVIACRPVSLCHSGCCSCGSIRVRRRRWCSTPDRPSPGSRAPYRGIYDNMKTAVETIFTGVIACTSPFPQMWVSPVDPVAARRFLGEAAENQVGLVRERFHAASRFKTLDELNAWLLDKCIASPVHRHPELTEQTIWEVFEAERL